MDWSKKQTAFAVPESVAPEMDLTDNVERAGYIPLAEQIRQAQRSGVITQTTRALQYDMTGEMVDDEKFDQFFNRVTAVYDLVDLDNLRKEAKGIQERYKDAVKAAETAQKAQTETPAPDVSTQPVEQPKSSE